jgi:HPt (histidine-containing phosphotransfer) domain-containing protein
MADKFQQLKLKYTNSFEQKQKDLKKAWIEKEFGLLEELLHKLAGSSGSYGFDKLSKLCRQAMEFVDETSSKLETESLENILVDIFTEMSDIQTSLI